MSSYAERLGAFNSAVAATNQHVDTLKSTLQNKELLENPAKMGTELAGQVLGTTGGFIGIRNRISGDAETRRTQSAFFNRLGQIGKIQSDTTQGVGDALQKGLNSVSSVQKNVTGSINNLANQQLQNVRSAGQSLGSQVADTGKIATNSIQNIKSGAASAAATPNFGQPSSGDLRLADGGIADKISNVSSTSEANDVNREINQKIANNLSADEISEIQSKLPQTLVNRVNTANQVGARGDAFAQNVGQKLALNIKNNAANHAIASKNATGNLPDAFDDQGNGIYNSQPATKATTPSSLASADQGGIASSGSNASSTIASDTGGTASSALPHGGNANVGSATDLNPVQGLAGDTSTASQTTADAGANIAQRAQNLKLTLGQVPSQSGTGTVQGLTTAPTANTASGQAHIVSQAQQADASQHATAQASGSQVQADASAQTSGAKASAQQGAQDAQNAMNNAGVDASQASRQGASAGANIADDTGNGIKTALGIEGTLDELAPESGPLGPLLEAGSLLATLGTSIAGLFEKPKEQSSAPAPAPQTLSVGANLKGDASGSVGAF